MLGVLCYVRLFDSNRLSFPKLVQKLLDPLPPCNQPPPSSTTPARNYGNLQAAAAALTLHFTMHKEEEIRQVQGANECRRGGGGWSARRETDSRQGTRSCALKGAGVAAATAYVHAVCPRSPPPSTCLLTIWHLKGQKSIEEAAEKEEITFQQ